MTGFWRRQATAPWTARGRAFNQAGNVFGEESPGRRVDAAVFACDPCNDRGPRPARPARLAIEARLGVSIRARGRPPWGGRVDQLWTDLIALGAGGGFPDRAYFWVQIYSREDETITEADGSTRVEDILQDTEAPRVGSPDDAFLWGSRRWTIDNNQTATARYSLAQPTFGSPNCDTLYDNPSNEVRYAGYLHESPSTLRVACTIHFHSFLYGVPLRPEDRELGYLVRMNPVASVAWSFHETIGRERAGELVRALDKRYSVHFIHPDGVAPAGMRRVFFGVFHGR